MYYKYNGVTQRLAGCSSRAAYCPQGLKPNLPAESPQLIFAAPNKLSLDHGSAELSGFSRGNKVPMLQKFFQRPDGVPIHLKGGYPDRLLYRITMALTIGGAIYSLISLYIAAMPKKK